MSYAKQHLRGLIGVRADANDPNSMIKAINTAFEEFKATNDANGKKRDVLLDEKTSKINTDISILTAEIDKMNAALAAIKIGGAEQIDPAKAEHAKAFNRFFRKGIEDGLGDMQVKAALSTNSDPDGGYLVPDEMETAIDRVLSTVSTIRSLASVLTISQGDTHKLLVSQGGAGSGWVGESEGRTATATPTLKEIAINLGELYANAPTTQKALDDARIDVGGWLAEEVSTTFAEQEGSAFVTGSGVNQPRGILSYTNVANASYAWGSIGFIGTGTSGAYATTAPADALVNLYYALKAGYRNNASFLMSDATAGTTRLQKDGQGNYLWGVPQATGENSTIMGKPVYTDDNMSAIAANSYSVAFADFRRAYQIVDKMGIRVLRDPYTSKPNVLFYVTKRVGGGIRNFEAIKLLKFI